MQNKLADPLGMYDEPRFQESKVKNEDKQGVARGMWLSPFSTGDMNVFLQKTLYSCEQRSLQDRATNFSKGRVNMLQGLNYRRKNISRN